MVIPLGIVAVIANQGAGTKCSATARDNCKSRSSTDFGALRGGLGHRPMARKRPVNGILHILCPRARRKKKALLGELTLKRTIEPALL